MSQVEIRRFCGIPTKEEEGVFYACDQEAIGGLTVLAEGEFIEVAVCQEHLEKIKENYTVELDNECQTVVL